MEPKLRFTKFNSEWKLVSLEKVICERSELASDIYPLYSLTIENGVEKKTARYNREFLVKKIQEAYKILYPNDFVINPMNLRFGAIAANKLNETGRISKYYDIFSIKNNASFYFFDQLLTSKKMLAIYERVAVGGLNEKKRVHFSNFVKIKVPVPQLEEQNQISDFLSAVDKKIMLLNKQHDLLCQYKKGMMQKIFSQDMRFKDENGDVYSAWKIKPLKELYTLLNTNSLSRSELNYENGNIKNIHYGDIHTRFNSRFDITKELVPYISKNIKIAEECYCRKGDLVIADASEDYNDIGKCIEIINVNQQQIVAGLHTFLARPNSSMALGFGSYVMQSSEVRRQMKIIATGVSVLSITKKNLLELMIPLPSIEEQTKIANLLSAFDDKIVVKKTELDNLKTWKQGLLQQMFI